jgi:hypothetical protein
MRYPLTAGILILALVAQFGCASSRTSGKFVKMSTHDLFPDAPEEVVPPSPGETVRLGSGKVVVTSGRFDPKFDIVGGPTKGAGWGAAKGAVEGFFAPLQIVAAAPQAILIAPFLMPIGLVAGLVEGAKAEPAVKVEEREAAIREMVAGQKIQDDLRDRVAAIGRAKTTYTLTALTDRGPSAPGERPDYRPLSQEGIQTVLEVVVESVTLQGGGSFDNANPSLVLRMTVNGRWVRTVDNAELYRNTLTYYNKSKRTLAEWVGDPESFRNELNQVSADIAEKTVKEVLLRKLQ